MNPLELMQNQMDFIEESVKKTFRIPVKEITEYEAENSALEVARDEDDENDEEEDDKYENLSPEDDAFDQDEND